MRVLIICRLEDLYSICISIETMNIRFNKVHRIDLQERPDRRIVVPRPHVDQARIFIVMPTGVPDLVGRTRGLAGICWLILSLTITGIRLTPDYRPGLGRYHHW